MNISDITLILSNPAFRNGPITNSNADGQVPTGSIVQRPSVAVPAGQHERLQGLRRRIVMLEQHGAMALERGFGLVGHVSKGASFYGPGPAFDGGACGVPGRHFQFLSDSLQWGLFYTLLWNIQGYSILKDRISSPRKRRRAYPGYPSTGCRTGLVSRHAYLSPPWQ